ncbi:MAG: phosphoglycerate kinase [Verrucomicrobia bacterium]|nr:phosphoglycerate kinase [Verrucomicrobiota bacterium]
MNKKSIQDLSLKGKRVLMRVDFNVPIQDGKVADDTRIEAALPTIRYVLEQGASVVLMSHLGRPKGKVNPEFSLKPVADRLAEVIDAPVSFAGDCVGKEVEKKAKELKPGGILLLENLRFHSEEEGKPNLSGDETDEERAAAKADMKAKQKDFAAQLADLGDVYVNDAFGTAHRAHASMAVVTDHFEERAAGFLLEKEIEYLGSALANPERPFVAIIGGAKISGKIDVITNLLGKVDSLLIGGGMAYTFYKAQGKSIGESLLEEDKVGLAGEILAKAEQSSTELLLPVDNVIADAFDVSANTKVVSADAIPDGWQSLDIGPETRKIYSEKILGAKTVVWNGPMGVFEMEPFAAGTLAVAQALADSDAVSIIGGGDSVSAVNKTGLADKMTHISTGGGASLEFLEGKSLPGVDALSDK